MNKERFVIFSAKEKLAICMHNLTFSNDIANYKHYILNSYYA